MPLTDPAANLALDAIGAAGQFISVHGAVPDALGSSELAGGTPTYARLPAVWQPAAFRALALDVTTPAIFDIPAGSSVAFIGVWDALTAGNFLGFAPANGGASRGVALTDGGTAASSPGHPLVVGDRLMFRALPGIVLPSGINVGTLYHVIDTTASIFRVALSPLAAPVTIGAGAVSWQRVAVDVFANQGTFEVGALTFGLGA